MAAAPKKSPDLSSYSGRFAARLRTLREKTGLTGQEFAQALVREGYQLAERTYYRWETGLAEPPYDALPTLAKLLGQKSPRTLFPTE